jgi:hypothetical protein
MLAMVEALQRVVLSIAVTPEPHELPEGLLVDNASYIRVSDLYVGHWVSVRYRSASKAQVKSQP